MADSEFWSQLGWTEKVGCAVGHGITRNRLARGLATRYQSWVSVPILGQTINDRLHTRGLEHVPLDRSFIFAANHRSYFDLYAVMLATWRHFARPPHLYCPVRTGFFYEKPVGVVFNLAICGNAMYPPVFRDQRGPLLNRYAVDRAVELLDRDPRTIIAIHPEGRRNQGPDPYTYLPPKVGVGRIGLRARCPVLPVFVNGLPAKFDTLVGERLSRRGTPVRVTIGPPVDLDDLYGGAGDPTAEREAAERVMTGIAAMGELDREEWA